MGAHNANIQTHLDEIYSKLGQSSRGGALWDALTYDERAFFCTIAKVGNKNDLIHTAQKKLSEFNDVEQYKILQKIKGLQRLTAPFANLSRYEFK